MEMDGAHPDEQPGAGDPEHQGREESGPGFKIRRRGEASFWIRVMVSWVTRVSFYDGSLTA